MTKPGIAELGKVLVASFPGTRADTENLPKLRDIADAENILDQFLTETEGEETPELAELSEALKQDAADFFERWGLWLRNRKAECRWLDGQAAPFKEEHERITARRKALEAAIARSEARLLYEMQLRSIPKVEGKLLTVARQLNPAKVVGAEAVPVEDLMELYTDSATRDLVRYQPESYALDKDAVKKLVSTGHLPDMLKKHGVGTVQDERVVVK